MSVSNGQKGNQTTFNNAFGSKTSSSTINSVWTLNEAGSGGAIANMQQQINNNSNQVVATQDIAANGTISSNDNRSFQKRRVQGTPGNVTASGTPFGSGGTWDDGIVIELMGMDDTKKVKILHNDVDYGIILNGDINLGEFDTLTVEWVSSKLRWVERSRSV